MTMIQILPVQNLLYPPPLPPSLSYTNKTDPNALSYRSLFLIHPSRENRIYLLISPRHQTPPFVVRGMVGGTVLYARYSAPT